MPQPPSIFDELASKKATINEYKNATDTTVPPKVSGTVSKPTVKDKVNPKGAPFGSKPGEKRMNTSDMTKPLGSYKHGTDYVPKTGVYKLHEGEAVKTKDENMKDMYKKVHEGDSKPKKSIKRIVTHKSHDGKFIHTHEHHHPEHHGDETHVSNDMSELHKHMEDVAGTPNQGEAPAGNEQMAQLSATPPPAAPPAGGMPGQGGM